MSVRHIRTRGAVLAPARPLWSPNRRRARNRGDAHRSPPAWHARTPSPISILSCHGRSGNTPA